MPQDTPYRFFLFRKPDPLFQRIYCRGFTLTEFAVVMALSGLLMMFGMRLYDSYVTDKYLDTTYEQHRIVRDSMDDFFAVHGRYPCPARANISIEDPNAGLEDCTLRADTHAIGTCANGICKRRGRATAFAADGPILVGAIPFKTMKQGIDDTEVCKLTDVDMSDTRRLVPCPPPPMGSWPANIARSTEATTEHTNMRAILDVWGYQMTYAVTQSLTDSSTFDHNDGSIGVITENGSSLVDPPRSAHYVVVYHGDNNKGAFSANGIIAEPCTAGTRDAVNCDKSQGSGDGLNEGTFMAGMRSMVTGANYFDDILMFQAYSPPKTWRMTGSGVEPLLVNANRGNVGIGTNEPSQQLHIGGNLQATLVGAARICDATGQNCFRPENLYTPGSVCPSTSTTFTALQGFNYAGENISSVCGASNIPRPTVTDTLNKCLGASEVVVGFRGDGSVICGAL